MFYVKIKQTLTNNIKGTRKPHVFGIRNIHHMSIKWDSWISANRNAFYLIREILITFLNRESD